MIDFEEKLGRGEFDFRNSAEGITDLLTTPYDEPTGAMRQLTQHLLPIIAKPEPEPEPVPEPVTEPLGPDTSNPSVPAASALPTPSSETTLPLPGAVLPTSTSASGGEEGTVVPPVTVQTSTPLPENLAPTYDWSNVDFNVVEEASKSPLDGAIAAAISMAGSDNKIKAASMSILLIGGTSALKGLGAFVSERYVHLYFESI